ncbi:TonB-dependent receptor [Pseudomaricurvus alkylphenolicus]|uniref:TonB-dependent receptor n=1 Tax=Pseudomaricurvus alkylphenolicus TaxID=1306991 RepID=UPI001420D155|nr:TonB-dependent receptor [Pseudomaricurvus alkylphenolicus]NIB44212.1 TonB-dependent receptor [Pseudomaricurvus alkylphenolicus]
MKNIKLRNAIQHINKSVLAYGSLGAMALFSLSAATQAQETPGFSSDEQALASQIEEIEVMGIRRSLKRALDVKESSNSIVDAISAEDIGKFPDKNVADSLQRIPGVSVDRGWGEGRDIFVRGTDSALNRTLMNGQNVASAFWWANDNPSRGFNYSMLASELVSGLEVYKSPEADLDEGSIGGAVIVRTRRPLDLDPLTINASVEGLYSELPDEVDPQASGLISWSNESGSFGVLASFASQKRTMRRDGLEAFPTNSLYDVTDQHGNVTNDVYAVWGGGSAIFSQERERETSNLTLQWRPTDQWDIVFNAVQSGMDMDNNNQNYLFLAGGAAVDNNIAVTDPRFIDTSDGKQALVGGTLQNLSGTGAAIEPIYRRGAYVETEVYDIDATFEGNGWQAHMQVGITEASGGSDHDQNYWFEGPTRSVINLGPETVEFSYLDMDATDASALTLKPGNFRDFIRKMEDEETYLQGDLTFDVEWGPVNSFKVGAKYRDHTIENNRTTGRANPDHPRFAELEAITLADVSSSLTPKLHEETASAGSLTQYAWLDEDLARERIDSILEDGVWDYNFDQNAHYNINEEITAVYAKADFETEKMRGNFGLRVVKTDLSSSAYQNGELGTVSTSYTDYLPSLNLVYNLSENINIRAAASKAMARPSFQKLSSNLVVDATNGETATAGNPLLDPFYAKQFEIGAEWYFGDAGILSGTYFYKDMSTYIVDSTQVEVIDGQNVSVTRPFNAEGAKIQGLELQWQQELGMGFGIVANYTFTDGEIAASVGDFELPGNSEDQANASVYYEDSNFSARLSYNYRSESYGDLVSGSQRVIAAYDQWDATFNWNATDNIDVFVTAVNLTNEVIYQTTSDGIPGWGFYENGRRFSAGLRMNF